MNAKAVTTDRVLIVFARDEKNKPHASAFDQSKAELAVKAAGLMGMHTLRVETDEQRAIAIKVPKGRVFASGKAFVPFIRSPLYDRLAAMASPVTPQSPIGEARRPTAASPAVR
jgi:hypothetical protein